MIDHKKLSDDKLAHIEKCELTGESFSDYIDYSIPYERAIQIQGFQSDLLVREECKILRENGYCTRTGRLDIHINNIIANILNYKNRYNVHYFYYQAHKNEYYVPKRYNPLRITYNPFRASIEGLFALSLGCGSKSKDVEDCVERWLPSVIGSGSLNKDQINEIKRNEGLMGEIVFAIEEMNRFSDNEPTQKEKEQARAQEGYYKAQPNGQFVWVDTRSGYEKFTDRFCINCSTAQVYMINRATKKYFQGAPLSGFDKFILRGGGTRKVIKFYK